LRELVRSLALGSRTVVALHNEAGIESVEGCKLELALGRRDDGVRERGPQDFQCVLSPSGWDNVDGLLQPFCESESGGFQWLSERGAIALLISRDGRW